VLATVTPLALARIARQMAILALAQSLYRPGAACSGERRSRVTRVLTQPLILHMVPVFVALLSHSILQKF